MKIKEFETLQPGTEVVHTGANRHGTVVRTSASTGNVLVLFEGGDKEWIEYYKIEKSTKEA